MKPSPYSLQLKRYLKKVDVNNIVIKTDHGLNRVEICNIEAMLKQQKEENSIEWMNVNLLKET